MNIPEKSLKHPKKTFGKNECIEDIKQTKKKNKFYKREKNK